jgi:hypothetical protein
MWSSCIDKIAGYTYQRYFSGTFARCSLGLLFYIKSMYTNLVVIVNEEKIVDKSLTWFVYRGLRREKVAGQGLYRSGMTVGQKSDCG